jgi:hypothetical protein
MYANDNRDHYPDRLTTGRWSFRRKPGTTNPLDPSSYPEWLGLAAVLHGIKVNDYDINMSIDQVQMSLGQMLSTRGRYMSGVSEAWVCPAFPAPFAEFGNTYAFSIADEVSRMTSVHRGRIARENHLVVWDNSNFKPYAPGLMAPPSVGPGMTFVPQIHPHRINGKSSRNELYYDGRADTKRF